MYVTKLALRGTPVPRQGVSEAWLNAKKNPYLTDQQALIAKQKTWHADC